MKAFSSLRRRHKALLVMLFVTFSSACALDQTLWEKTTPSVAKAAGYSAFLPAFPGAEGFGANAVGGRGGRVIEVTNLNDQGPGSLRAALEAEGPRIVTFRVGGTIELQSRISIENPYITIAGQTAPGDGITVKNNPINRKSPLQIKTHDVIMRYIRSRPGPSTEPSDILDALTIPAGYNIIVDHCSFSWSTDEVVNTWNDAHDITVQWSIIAEGLQNSNHPRGPHSMGMLLGSDGANNITIHHNLFAHNRHRNPKVNLSGVVDIVNNVMYNTRYAAEVEDSYANPEVNYVANYVKHGPNSFYDFDLRYWEDGKHPPAIYVADNIGVQRLSSALRNDLVVRAEDRQYVVMTRHSAPQVTTTAAVTAYAKVLATVGATLPVRDAVDTRIIHEVQTGAGREIDNPSDVGGWPLLASGIPPVDTDHDGMPDSWEKMYKLDPTVPDDGAQDADRDGYTNIEEYLNNTSPIAL